MYIYYFIRMTSVKKRWTSQVEGERWTHAKTFGSMIWRWHFIAHVMHVQYWIYLHYYFLHSTHFSDLIRLASVNRQCILIYFLKKISKNICMSLLSNWYHRYTMSTKWFTCSSLIYLFPITHFNWCSEYDALSLLWRVWSERGLFSFFEQSKVTHVICKIETLDIVKK